MTGTEAPGAVGRPGSPPASSRSAWAEIDLAAVKRNVATLRRHVAPASVLAVVKADGYGHGALECAHAALSGGATWLGVATVEEGVALRDDAIEAPVLVLADPPELAADALVEARLSVVVSTRESVSAISKAASESAPVRVHLKIDTGMHRIGADPSDAASLLEQIDVCPGVVAEGILTHLAVADEPDNPFTDAQLDRFDAVLAGLRRDGRCPPIVHAANSAAAIAVPRARYDLVRCGIAIYGIPPAPALAGWVPLEAAMRLVARVTAVRRIGAGEGVSYGLAWRSGAPTSIATVPLGYADGIPRSLGRTGGEVLVHGTRCPIVGNVTMDQLMIDVGELPVAVGDEVVLIGAQGTETVTADDWASAVDTIAYEIVTRIGTRVPRRYG